MRWQLDEKLHNTQIFNIIYFFHFSERKQIKLLKMQLHIRGQNNHVLEVQPTETIGEIKVSIECLIKFLSWELADIQQANG